ncbi:hypothetical protein [Actinomadura sp. WMMA1423]|uniref:hypothetical protein n=1 Tax=Actinomadura sp. WMMA1423 TaxID=2591108 RepID=UPI00143DAD37|nr:hypothetical protein [Actinomadura sp. WMMA1423]
MPGEVTIVDGGAVPWVNGRDVYDTMEPAFRDNLGDPDRVAGLLSRYWMRSLWHDPVTSRRIDHVRTDPGYRDLCEAYHDSVEEALFLGGRVELTAEGVFEAGDYFWRPPGWVHSAATAEGFECLLMMEGESPADGSGRVSRVVRPDEDAGRHARPGPADPIGPRGYVRRKEGRFMVWREHDDTVTRLADRGVPGLRSKTLSSNAVAAGASVLVDLPAGWSRPVPAARHERFLISTEGVLTAGGAGLEPCSLIAIPAGAEGPPLETAEGARLLVKVAAS